MIQQEPPTKATSSSTATAPPASSSTRHCRRIKLDLWPQPRLPELPTRCDGIDMGSRLRDLRPHVLLFLNIPKYSAGTVPWGHTSGPENQQRIDDKKIEVIGLTTAALATLQMGGHGDRICQCSEVHLTTRKTIPMQIDGEPCRLCPSTVEIKLRNQAFMVQKSRRLENGSPAHFGAINTSGRLVKIFIIYPDQDGSLETLEELCRKAEHFTSLRIGAYSDLGAVRRRLKNFSKSLRNCGDASTLPKNWIFLDMTSISGRVYGIEPTLESAHFITDILSNSNELFLVNQDGQKPSESANPQLGPREDISAKTSISSQGTQWDNSQDNLDFCLRRGIIRKSISSLYISSTEELNRSPTILPRSPSCPPLRICGTHHPSNPSLHLPPPLHHNQPPNSILSSDAPQHDNAEVEDDVFEDQQHLGGGTSDADVEEPADVEEVDQDQESPVLRGFKGWQRRRHRQHKHPPRILVSAAAGKVSQGSSAVGVAPDRVQSLSRLLQSPSMSQFPSHSPASSAVAESANAVTSRSRSSETLAKPPNRNEYGGREAEFNGMELDSNLNQLIQDNLRTYYLASCRSGHLQGVRNALDAGVSPLSIDPLSGRSGLHHAAEFGRLPVVKYLLENASRSLLDLQDYDKKQTALHKAASNRRRRVCEALVKAGASTTLLDVNGNSPRLLAHAAKDSQLAHFLQNEEIMQMIAREVRRCEL